MNHAPLILLTNDDGIDSPGLHAAAAALSELGWVLVAAPREQQTGMGRSMPIYTDGQVHIRHQQIDNEHWEVYAVGGSPAQVVQHALFEITERPPDLVVSGINYGENVGSGVMISGTVGAAMEAASHGIPALAVSLQTEHSLHHTHSPEVDFSAAAHFTRLFARRMLTMPQPDDLHVLKLDIPANATPETGWRLVRQGRQRYYLPERAPDGRMGYQRNTRDKPDYDSDIYALTHQQLVAVTPLSLDMTSRIDFIAYAQSLGDLSTSKPTPQ